MRHLTVDPAAVDVSALAPAVRWIAAGGLVVFPTDTFYGLGVDPRSASAVAALFDLKGRDPQMAVPVIAASPDDVRRAAGRWSAGAERLARAFWPGPLSVVIDAPAWIEPRLHGGRVTIAVRVPAHGVARALAAACGGWLTATSANRSGAPPVREIVDLDSIRSDPRVFVVDAGPTPGGVPSTIVDARFETPTLVREGAIAWGKVLESITA